MNDDVADNAADTARPSQDELTKIARRKGREKAKRNWRAAKEAGHEALTKVGNATVRKVVNGLMDILIDDLEKADTGRAHNAGPGLRLLKDAPIADVSLAVARAAVNGMTAEWISGISLQARLGAAAEDAILDAKWRKLAPGQAEAVRALISRSRDPLQRRMAKKAYAHGWQKEILDGGNGWDEHATKTVGATMMHALIRLGMFEHARELVGNGARRKTNGVCLTEEACHWISNAIEHDAASAEVQYPSIDPPIPWTAPFGGGVHGRGPVDHPSVPSNQRPFCILRNARKEHKELLRAPTTDLSTVYAALNAAQQTPWRINPRVFDVFAELRRIGKGGAGLEPADNPPKPVYPERAAGDEAAHEKFKAERRDYYASVRKAVSRRKAERDLANTVEMCRAFERFHFVYNVDFRGRAYACSDYLSPQGDDLQRGFLEFAAPDEMTDDGVWWLKLHLANSFGKDKESLNDRIVWANANRGWFQRIAANPIDLVHEWERADCPWQFLAACFAWDDFERGERLCRLPVYLDGSCSGIQHSSALVADDEAGGAVNLVPRQASEKPADIYAVVAERAMELLRDREARLDIHAHRWLHEWGVTRSDTKASVMTLPYGGTEFGNLNKVRKSVEKQIRKGKKRRPSWLAPGKDNREAYNEAMKVLSEVVWAAMAEVVKVPLKVMAYFKACARTLKEREDELRKQERRKAKGKPTGKGKEDDDGPHLRFSWTSPCGFPVLCDYRVPLNRRTSMKDEATGRAITFVYYAYADQTHWPEVISTAPPHFIHSLDASHLMRSVERSGACGIDQIAIVHDAFGTTPSKVGALAQLLRDEFVRMYSEDVLEGTLGTMLDAMGASRPAALERGQLDIAGISRSPYLFA